MAKRRGQAARAIERVSEPVVRVVERTRRKLSTGPAQKRMGMGDVAAGLGGAVLGSLAYQAAAHGLKLPALASAAGVTALGGVGAYLLDGKPQFASVGMAGAGLVHSVSHALNLRNASGAAESEIDAEIARIQKRPRDLEEAFDLARRRVRPPLRRAG